MKTIEERVEYWTRYCWERGISATSGTREALRELAADLQAEKEKEVAELKEKLATLARDYSEAVAGESEMEELTRLRAMLNEAKRVLENVRGFEIIGERTRSKIDQLLTRLGSHE